MPHETAPLMNEENAASLLETPNGDYNAAEGGFSDLHMSKNDSGSAGGKHNRKSNTVGAKSLIMCLVVENPFDPNLSHPEPIIDESAFEGLSADAIAAMRGKGVAAGSPRENIGNASFVKSQSSGAFGADESVVINATSNPIPPTFLCDDDFLLSPSNEKKLAPNRFQKVIELILRLQKKGLDIEPENMLVPCDISKKNTTANYFHGYALQESRILSSPDRDELYIKIHASSDVLFKFAEIMSLPLLSHNYSFGGGAAIPYSRAVHKKLNESVDLYHKAYGLTEEQNYTQGKENGFYFDPQHKMRILIRLLREQWRFGGCGIQINELRKKKVFVRNLFPLHNHAYLSAKGLHDFASLRALVSINPLKMNKENVMCYFGEEVGLYFIWIKEFSLVMIPLGAAGLICGIGGSFRDRAIFNAAFAICCIAWACYWNVHWGRVEAEFALENCQEEQLEQEPLRDEFEFKDIVNVEYKDIYDLSFNVPLSLQIQSDGSMVDLYYPNIRRQLVRFLFSYPIVLILTASMLAALTGITWWRFQHSGNVYVNYGSSVLTVVTSVVFGFLFEKIVEFLNSLENNRTDSEEDHERIKKSFLFYFFSNYYALFILALYPLEGPQYERLTQLQSQMIIICLVKPMIQNIQELAVPFLKSQLRTRIDAKGGLCGAMISLVKCESYSDVIGDFDPEDPGTKLWLEAQMEPAGGTSGDYLEITLQFGFMAMFGATFPFAAPAAVLYNFLEVRIDALKYIYHTQRPIASPAATIGPWARIFVLLTMCSVVTNSYLVIILSPFLSKVGYDVETSEARQWEVLLATHYVFIVFMILLTASIGTTSPSVVRLRSKRKMLSNKATREKAANHFRNMLREKINESYGGTDAPRQTAPLPAAKAGSPTTAPPPPLVTSVDGNPTATTNEPFLSTTEV